MRKYGGGRKKHAPKRKHAGGPTVSGNAPHATPTAKHIGNEPHGGRPDRPRHAKPATALSPASDYRIWLAAGLGVIVLQALALHLMGHVAICKCGTIKLWHGITNSSENSQHIADWYTFSHVLHGLIFYAVLHVLMPKASWATRLAAAVAIEAGWEVVENTDFIINRYRSATISLDYYGDSILNSVMDNVAMVAGFLLARAIPVAASVVLFFALELFMLWAIRDNLTLNVLMLLWPVEGIAKWQAGG